jgi:hypothetical protein
MLPLVVLSILVTWLVCAVVGVGWLLLPLSAFQQFSP